MCPACIASAAMMAAGAGSTGGILAVCIGKFRKFFQREWSRSISENEGEIKWHKQTETWSNSKNIRQ
jgi:hypothetical protein